MKTNFSESLKGYTSTNEWAFDPSKNCFYRSLCTFKKLNTRVYRLKDQWIRSECMATFTPVNIHSDNICFEDYTDEVKEVIQDIDTFWSSLAKFNKFKLLQKLGIMFYGPPGTGKTVLINYIITKHLEEGGVVLIGDGDIAFWGDGITQFRDVEPDRRILFLIEDIDCYIKDTEKEKILLNVLDGNHNTNNVLFLATTNYPEKLDSRLIDRPGRFHCIVELGVPSADKRKTFFTKEFAEYDHPITKEELKFLVDETEGFSMAHCRNVINGILIFDREVRSAVNRAKAAKKINNKTVGFIEDAPKKSKAGFSTELKKG